MEKMYRVAEIKCKSLQNKNEINLIDDNLYPKFKTYQEAFDWIHKAENYQKEWTIIEVFIDKKYLS